jgi:hypothetical protein
MLVITTTVRLQAPQSQQLGMELVWAIGTDMVNGVHGNTTSLGP